jgi:hypothetical protein
VPSFGVAPSAASAILAVVGTLVVFVPLATVSFVALARKEAKALSVAFFASNLLVLVPVRQPLTVALLAGITLLALLRLELKRFGVTAQLDTVEGKLGRAMPFAAPLIMLGRVFHLYHAGAAFVGSVLLIGASALWLLLRSTLTTWKKDLGAWLAAALGVIGWSMCWSELAVRVSGLGRASVVLLLGLPTAALFALAARRAARAQGLLISVATVTALVTTLSACTVDWSTIGAAGCILIGVAVAVWGASMRALLRTVSGSLVAVYGLGVQVWLATHADNVLRWAGLSVVGVLLIVGSAYVERNRAKIGRFWAEAAARRLEHEHA